jgi:hypothetical protein
LKDPTRKGGKKTKRNERMRTIAITSYFNKDFKKNIEWMMMIHPYN